MDLDIGLDLDIDEYELTNSSYQQSSAPTSELGDPGSPIPQSLLNDELNETNNINIILKQSITTHPSNLNIFCASTNYFNPPTPSRLNLETKNICNLKRGPGRPRKGSIKLHSKKRIVNDSISGSSVAIHSFNDSTNMGFVDQDVKLTVATSHIEEPPYFTEKYPGKICCLCNLCERSSLGQGDMLRISINEDTFKNILSIGIIDVDNIIHDQKHIMQDSFERRKNVSKNKVTINNELINELDYIGYDEVPLITNLPSLDESHIYIHNICAMWCFQMKRIDTNTISDIEHTIVESLMSKCSYCHRFGASVSCYMSCSKKFHLPCAAAASCFLIIESFSIFCSEHISQVSYISIDTNIECRQCSNLGEISKLLMCCTCGAHYHTTCVGLANFPDSRAGWNCQQCCKCLICRDTDNTDGRYVKCEQCQKLYHTTCLRPIISSIPKYGWKCNRCRVCSDCGARTPGAGASSRWHCHYTICDSCYQQRNKGFSCPICHKAYRTASHKEMVKCTNCNKFVHSTCDSEADLTAYHLKKEVNPDYEYICRQCKTDACSMKQMISSGLSTDSSTACTESISKDQDLDLYDKDGLVDFSIVADVLKLPRKRMAQKDLNRGGKINKFIFGKVGALMNPITRKRRARGRGRQFISPNSNISHGNGYDNNQSSDEDMALEKKIILCSANDKFILMQDVCVMCGSLGTDNEACLISCVQCGQCYHPHCANITLTKTMLQKGWRCLDCTVCEGCGQKNDEARLILCDECDISYHIYCMNPPLDSVPNGNWKCKWCAICQKCGRSTPGKNSSWLNGFLECGPCASQISCFVCSQNYNDNELIIQCINCERWSHCFCDSIENEEDAQTFNDIDYYCMACRAENNIEQRIPTKVLINDKSSLKMINNVSNISGSIHDNVSIGGNNSAQLVAECFDTTDNVFWMDGVCVSEQGFNMIRSLTAEIKRKRKMRTDTNVQKDLKENYNQNPIDQAHSSGTPTSIDKEEKSIAAPTYKDGMIWFGEDGSQPQGFSISTNDEGVNILRKKRQRNLQKLGIGGFNVRMRGLRKDNDEMHQGENANLFEMEKKKKMIRKKAKTKLTETYPAYLQEAFFGKVLLENKGQLHISFDDSDSLDGCSALALKPLDDVSNQEERQKQESQSIQLEINKQNTDTNDLQKTLNFSSNIKNSDNTEKSKLKEISSTNVIKAENGSKISILQQNENKISKVTKSDSAAIMLTTNPVDMQPILNSNQSTIAYIPNAINSIPNAVNNIPNVINNNQQQTHHTQDIVDTHIHQQQFMEQRIQFQQSYNHIGIPNNGLQAHHQFLSQKTENTVLNTNKIERDIVYTQIDPTIDRLIPETTEISAQVDKVNIKDNSTPGTQKTAEKMRKDEDLGEMATISAVLYANTQHPELKHLYPNWNERCKQILKKWRSLSTEMKAPFLQHAKDNRSVLRLRRSQQEPDKMYFQQKTLKEQEQERVWKQHQAKTKEAYANKIINKNAFMGNYSRPEATELLINKHPQPSQVFDIDILSENNEKLHNALLQTEDPIITLPQEVQNINSTSAKSFSQYNSHNQFINTLTSNDTSQTETQNQTLNDYVKTSLDINKTDGNLNLMERNDIFMTDKNWPVIPKIGESNTIMTSVVVDKLDADENAGLGDILGGFGEGDDDDILKSLTAEIGDDFNILEYADPELDELNAGQHLLNKLDFDDNQKNL